LIDLAAARETFERSQDLTVGIEEEYALVHPDTLELVPRFEGTSGYKVTSLWVPSVQMMSRLKGGEVVDMMIMSSVAVDELVGSGVVAPADRFDLATCGVGVAVRAGAPKPARTSRTCNTPRGRRVSPQV